METGKKGFAQHISEYVVEPDHNSISAGSLKHAKVAFMDWMAVTLAGMDEPLVHKLIRHVELLGGDNQATVLGHNKKVNVAQSALVNGAMSHALDYDDTLPTFLGHPSVALFPGLLALSEWKKLSGSKLLISYLVGIQTGCWLGTCAGVDHYNIGWHGTSTIGRLASAAACAKLLDLNVEQTTHALGIAATQTSGLKQVFGSMCKPFHAGAAAQGGVTAALLAADGFDCAKDIFEGHHGFFQAFKGNPNEGAAEFLKNTNNIEMLSQKYHASCLFTHSPVEVMLGIAKENSPDPSDISEINVYCSQVAIDNAGKTSPTTGLDGKFSIPYCVANALIRKDTGIQAFTDEKLNDSEIKRLMEKISLITDDDHRDAELKTTGEVRTIKGETYVKTVDVLAENPDVQTKMKKTAVKFENLCTGILGKEKMELLKKAVATVDEAENLEEIITLSLIA